MIIYSYARDTYEGVIVLLSQQWHAKSRSTQKEWLCVLDGWPMDQFWICIWKIRICNEIPLFIEIIRLLKYFGWCVVCVVRINGQRVLGNSEKNPLSFPLVVVLVAIIVNHSLLPEFYFLKERTKSGYFSVSPSKLYNLNNMFCGWVLSITLWRIELWRDWKPLECRSLSGKEE